MNINNKYDIETILKNIHKDWKPFFDENKKELEHILETLNSFHNRVIYPNKEDIFKALTFHSPQDIKLVLLGQDPYIGEESDIPQATGLSFSVPISHKKIPPSLKNIFKEIHDNDNNYIVPKNGSLEKWAKEEKILLLNSSLTVFSKESNSHAKLWTDFTDKLISWFQKENKKCVFLLMGNNAISKSKLIENNKHIIFTTVHPSPLSANRGFFGCDVFNKINSYYKENNIDIIKW
jgi:uracil-DNA glycosylase